MNYTILIIVAIVKVVVGSYFGVRRPSKLLNPINFLKKFKGQEKLSG